MRKQWIDEGKPRHAEDEGQPEEHHDMTGGKTPIETNPGPTTDDNHDTAEQRNEAERLAASRTEDPVEGPEEDELDALLAEEAAIFAPPAQKSKPVVEQRDEFEDDMEAMEAMDDMW